MLLSSCKSDASIGPIVSDCRDGFDFTLRFETTVFAIVPSVAFILASLLRVWRLYKNEILVQARACLLAKLVASIAHLCLQAALITLIALPRHRASRDLVSAAACQFLAAACMTSLSYFEHGRSPRPSLLLTGHLILTIVLDAARCRTFWLAAADSREAAVAAVFSTAVGVKLVYLALESMQKTSWIHWVNDAPHSPEETSGLFRLGVYAWLNSLFLRGYSKVLFMEDLFPLDSAMRSAQLNQKFHNRLSYAALRRDRNGLLKTLARSLTVPLLLPVPPRLLFSGFTFCQPFFINSLLEYLSADSSEASENFAYGLIGASILIYGGIALSMAAYQYLRARSLQMIRGCLVAAIYTKLAEIEQVGSDQSETLTLMSADLERVRFGLRPMHNLWASFIEVGLASWLLYKQLGTAFLAPVVVVACCAGIISIIVKYIGKSQKTWMGWVQKRTSLTASAVAKMKSLRISGLMTPIMDSIQKLRVDELAAGSRFRALLVLSAVVGFVPLLLSPVLTFAVTQRTLDSTKIFTSLSYLILLANPLSALFQDIPQFFSAIACISRIQSFLEKTSRTDFRSSQVDSQQAGEKMTGISQSPRHGSGEEVVGQGISVKQGCFGWQSGNMILTDIDIDIPPGELTLVCGPTACGKTTLCRALLAELPCYSGTVALYDKWSPIAYCDQEPILFNDTIKNNILNGLPLDAQRYDKVLRATMLHVDMQSRALPHGDQTEVGSNASILSGGQKQRLALARALYLYASVVILDDVFSGLDNTTGKLVFNNLFGSDGLLRNRKCTVILCSNAAGHLPSADYIISLGSNGKVVEQGRFHDLMQRESSSVRMRCVDIPEQDMSVAASDSGSNDEGERDGSSPANTVHEDTLPTAMSTERQRGDSSTYKHYVKSIGYVLSGSILAWGATIGFSQNFPTVWLTYWGDDLASANPDHSSSYYIGIYALLNVCCIFCLASLGVTVFYIVVSKAGAKLHGDALDSLRHASLRYLTTTDQGKIVNIFSQDMNLIDTELPGALLNGVLSLSMAVGQAAVLTTSSPYLAISYPFLVALLCIIQRFYLRTSRQLRLLDLEAKSPLYSHFMDLSQGIITIRAFGLTEQHIEKGLQLLDSSQQPAYLLVSVQNWLILALDLVTMVIAAILTALAVKLRSDTGFTGASLVTLMSFGDQLTQIVIFLTLLETSLGAITRLKNFAASTTPEGNEDEVTVPSPHWPQHGEIELKNISASYSHEKKNGEGDNNASTPLALRDISLNIAPGEKVAICGRTGSGKSSLISLLLKLLDPLPGPDSQISLDGLRLGLVERSALRARVVAIPQDPVFLAEGTTFQENLDPLAMSEAAECQAALEMVSLWDTVQERGGLTAAMNPETLSAGQKQLFILGRAVVRHRIRVRSSGSQLSGKSPIGGLLLLDEVSANVDTDAEQMMQDIIHEEFKNYTVVAVSHRLNMILDYDRVIVMDCGSIAEAGKPPLLLQQNGTLFHRLWQSGSN